MVSRSGSVRVICDVELVGGFFPFTAAASARCHTAACVPCAWSVPRVRAVYACVSGHRSTGRGSPRRARENRHAQCGWSPFAPTGWFPISLYPFLLHSCLIASGALPDLACPKANATFLDAPLSPSFFQSFHS